MSHCDASTPSDNQSGNRPHLNRRFFGQSVIAVTASVACAPLWARDPVGVGSPKSLLAIKQAHMSDSAAVVKLWPRLTESFLRAALLTRCDAYRKPLAEYEWDAKFQSLIDKDARALMQTPLFKRFMFEPRMAELRKEWAKWPVAMQKRWATWYAEPQSKVVINSLRAEDLFDDFQAKDWTVDGRTGKVMATPVILLAQAWADLGVRDLIDQAIHRIDPALAKQWSRVKPFAAMSREDTPWLQSIAKALPQHNEKIYQHYDVLATQRWTDRRLWGVGGAFIDMPGEQESQIRPEDTREFHEASARYKLQDSVPATFAGYCGNR